MFDIQNLKFDAQGLIPAVVQDFYTNQVLMLAYMSRESLAISLREGRTCFWSRRRQELWWKGETSGNIQEIVSVSTDCDADTLLVRVIQTGPACHTGEVSCFFQPVYRDQEVEEFSADSLFDLLKERKAQPKEGSYTTYLFRSGLDKILKKVGEESAEVVIAAKNNDRREMVYELADLMYHAMVLMADRGISLEDVRKELAGRHIVDTKKKQESPPA